MNQIASAGNLLGVAEFIAVYSHINLPKGFAIASFYVAITPIPNGVYEMRVAPNGSRVCCFKIGDSDDPAGRFSSYRTSNPDVSIDECSFGPSFSDT